MRIVWIIVPRFGMKLLFRETRNDSNDRFEPESDYTFTGEIVRRWLTSAQHRFGAFDCHHATLMPIFLIDWALNPWWSFRGSFWSDRILVIIGSLLAIGYVSIQWIGRLTDWALISRVSDRMLDRISGIVALDNCLGTIIYQTNFLL
jgi:hypothetical protein